MHCSQLVVPGAERARGSAPGGVARGGPRAPSTSGRSLPDNGRRSIAVRGARTDRSDAEGAAAKGVSDGLSSGVRLRGSVGHAQLDASGAGGAGGEAASSAQGRDPEPSAAVPGIPIPFRKSVRVPPASNPEAGGGAARGDPAEAAPGPPRGAPPSKRATDPGVLDLNSAALLPSEASGKPAGRGGGAMRRYLAPTGTVRRR